MKNIKFTAFDLGDGHTQAGHVWKNYISTVDSIVFLIDTTDPSRFAKAKAELDVHFINNNDDREYFMRCEKAHQDFGNFMGQYVTQTGYNVGFDFEQEIFN